MDPLTNDDLRDIREAVKRYRAIREEHGAVLAQQYREQGLLGLVDLYEQLLDTIDRQEVRIRRVMRARDRFRTRLAEVSERLMQLNVVNRLTDWGIVVEAIAEKKKALASLEKARAKVARYEEALNCIRDCSDEPEIKHRANVALEDE